MPCLSFEAFAVVLLVAVVALPLARVIGDRSVARLHFRNRSCWIGVADPDQGKNRTRRPLSFIGFAHARGSAVSCGGATLLVRLSPGRSERLLPVRSRSIGRSTRKSRHQCALIRPSPSRLDRSPCDDPGVSSGVAARDARRLVTREAPFRCSIRAVCRAA